MTLSRAESKPNRRLETIEVKIGPTVYRNVKTGFTIVRATEVEEGSPVTVLCDFREPVSPGHQFQLTGKWEEHSTYGARFRAETYDVVIPATVSGLEHYLASFIDGIGPTTAQAIVRRFGESTVEVLDNNPTRLVEVPGIGSKRLAVIQSAWQKGRAANRVVMLLQAHGISPGLAMRVFKHYGPQALDVMRSDPFRLEEVPGIGFHTADRLAGALGIPIDSASRIEAGLMHVVRQSVQLGHGFFPAGELVAEAQRVLRLPDSTAAWKGLVTLVDRGALVADRDHLPAAQSKEDALLSLPVYLPSLHQAEVDVAAELGRIALQHVRNLEHTLTRWRDSFRLSSKLELSEEQYVAVCYASRLPVLVLTGGPGTGKTTTLRAIVSFLAFNRQSVLLAAPTGRAAQRLTEILGVPASTVHRLLGWDPTCASYARNRDVPLSADAVIIDESSMLDLPLASALLDAIRGSRLIIVGDVDQLPSVGPGTVLKDLISSRSVPVVRLSRIFRQGKGSLIVDNAHRINQGEPPDLVTPGFRNVDCYFVERSGARDAADAAVTIAARILARKRGLDPFSDIQVLCPMHRGACGASGLNMALQALLNPPSPDRSEVRRDRVFRIGDKVLQQRNDYRNEVFNGDIGTVVDIDADAETLIAKFGMRMVQYGFTELSDLAHGYALTVHKAQGSEYPCVVIPVHEEASIMLSRTLLYTAITRARDLCVLVGSRKAIDIALQKHRAADRYSALAARITRGHVPSDLSASDQLAG